MSSLEILAYPNPFLRKEAHTVTSFDEALKTLVSQMYVTMHESEGVGLAATQVGRDLNLFVLSSYVFMNEQEKKIALETGDMGADLVIINPRVVAASEEQAVDYEGCLSFPDVYVKVKRPVKVKIIAQNTEGENFELEGENFAARAILHEMDHLKGKVMTDHLSYISKTKALNKHKNIQKAIKAKKEQEALDSGEMGTVVRKSLKSNKKTKPKTKKARVKKKK